MVGEIGVLLSLEVEVSVEELAFTGMGFKRLSMPGVDGVSSDKDVTREGGCRGGEGG